MTEAWIYAANDLASTRLGRLLSELGFLPRIVGANTDLRPDEESGPHHPALAVVLATEGPPAAARICQRLREDDQLDDVPMLLVIDDKGMARGDDILHGDELIVQPFSAAELRARIVRARNQRYGADANEIVRVGSLELDLATHRVEVARAAVEFTHVEFELLKFFVTHPDRVHSRELLLNRVWGYEYFGGARTVDVHVRRLRSKLGSEHGTLLKTVRSVGYRFELRGIAPLKVGGPGLR
jgi:two-component system, OmpR family, alkaline phosphatase synthesis response regulator PhoP